jgi:hypothetical protein
VIRLSGFLHYAALFLLYGGGGVAAFVVLSVAELVGKLRRRLHRDRRLRLERYRTEQAIRSLRREAIRDMLEAERTHLYGHHDPEVIDGTAVEVER